MTSQHGIAGDERGVIPFFTLCSARSGTLYLKHLFQRNVKDCLCRHEPYLDRGNPTLFGPAIYDAYAQRVSKIRARLEQKKNFVLRAGCRFYLESSHAFLKAHYVAALEVFPNLRLIHVVRDPVKVAKSEAYREELLRRFHIPFLHYRGDDRARHFNWSLTGHEQIYQGYDLAELSIFQRCFLQWIEIENRAMRYLEQDDLHKRCFTLHAPKDLNDPAKVLEMFQFFGLETLQSIPDLPPRKNANWGHPTIVTAQDEAECASVLRTLPRRYLEIFGHEPYVQWEWSRRFR